MSESPEPRWTADEPKNGMVNIHCPDWLAFMEYVEIKHRTAHGRVYRGQKDPDWPIESQLLRETRAELRLQFSDWSPDDVDRVASLTVEEIGGNVMQSYLDHYSKQSESSIEIVHAWMIGRHQGLFTPFVDWTQSPYVAAFFSAVDTVESLEHKHEGHFAIYSANSWLFPFELSKRAPDNAELPFHALKVDAAFAGNPRGIAQQAVATYVYPQMDLKNYIVAWSKLKDSARVGLERILLPKKAASNAVEHLNRMNINYVTLFPDAFGLAKQANLNLLLVGYEGRGNWSSAPGFDFLIPQQEE